MPSPHIVCKEQGLITLEEITKIIIEDNDSLTGHNFSILIVFHDFKSITFFYFLCPNKGYGKTQESNRCRLNRLKQLPKEKQKASELIIIEHEDWIQDRKKHSRCILNQSATQCGCLLEWTTEPENGCFRYQLDLLCTDLFLLRQVKNRHSSLRHTFNMEKKNSFQNKLRQTWNFSFAVEALQ